MTVTETRMPGDQRWIDLEGADNMRDLGGLEVTGGGRTRFDRLLRSGTLQDLTADDVSYLVKDMGVHTVLDLRLPDEAEREGSALADIPVVRYLSLPLSSAGRIRPDTVADAAEIDIVAHYVALLEGSSENIVTAARVFTDEVNLPAVFHCAAGKDRTGVVVALALDAGGFDRDEIVRDYLATAERIDAIMARLMSSPTYRSELEGHDPRTHAPVPGTMERLFEILDERFGGSASWLSAHGLSDAELERLRRRMAQATRVHEA